MLWLGSEVALSADWGTWDWALLGHGAGSGGPLLRASMASAKLWCRALGSQPAQVALIIWWGNISLRQRGNYVPVSVITVAGKH